MSGASFAARLRRRELLVGTIVTLASAEVVEILSTSGLDWLFIDGEHAPIDFLAAQGMLAAARVPCLLRVPEATEAMMKRALDIGAAGVIVPMVNSAQQARAIVSFCKYPPRGTRGVGRVRAQGYGFDFERYMAAANDETVVVVQCEHVAAVEAIESIVAVDGVDAVLVGPYDLSGSMGLLGQVQHPEVLAAIERVARVCTAAGKALGIFTTAPEAMRRFVAQGYTLVAVGVDVAALGEAARATVTALRG